MLYIIWQLWLLPFLVHVKLEHSKECNDIYTFCFTCPLEECCFKILNSEHCQSGASLGQHGKPVAILELCRLECTLRIWDSCKVLDDGHGLLV